MLLAGCAVVLNSAFGAYLPQLGPSPLRFRPLPTFTATVAMFLPLRMDDPALPTNAEVVNSTTNSPPAASVEPLGTPPTAESAALGATNSAAQPASEPPPVVLDGSVRITPQMLVGFFKPVLNGTNAAPVTAPGGPFMPPQPQTPSPSSATYKSN